MTSQRGQQVQQIAFRLLARAFPPPPQPPAKLSIEQMDFI